MDKIHKHPLSLVLLSALIGGVIGALLSLSYIVVYPRDIFGGGLFFWFGAVSGAFFGIVSGLVGYAIKPRIWASMMAAALGSLVAPTMCWSAIGFIALSESITVSRLNEMYPESKPIPTIMAKFQEHASGEYIESCAISSDGSRLAFGSYAQIVLWDLNQYRSIHKFLTDYNRGYQILALSPDSLTLAHGDDDGVTLWDVTTGKELARLEGSRVNSLVFSPDGQMLAWTESEEMILWESWIEEEGARIKVPNGPISSLAFSPNSKLIAAGNSDGQITLWDTATRKPVGKLQAVGSVYSLAFSPDGRKLAAGINFGHQIDKAGIGLWDVDTRTRLAGTQSPAGSWNVVFSPYGQKLITSGNKHSSINFWDADNLEPLGSLSGPNAERSGAYVLPDGRVLACYWNQYLLDRIGIWTIESP